MKNNLNYIKGGVRLSNKWAVKVNGKYELNGDGALLFFLQNLQGIKILTDNSISCVTYILKLNDGIESPYVSIRSNNLDNRVNIILFKVGLISATGTPKIIPFNRSTTGLRDQNNIPVDRYNGQIEAVSESVWNREITIQQDLFIKTFNDLKTPLEPICPGIIGYTTISNEESLNYLQTLILSKLVQRTGNYAVNDKNVTKNLFLTSKHENVSKISLIVMEMMENYDTLANLSGNSRILQFQNMHKYELRRMVEHGYKHNDAHPGNVMINPSYPYFTTDPANPYYGRAIIIDFGRAENITPVPNPTIVGGYGDNGSIPIHPLDNNTTRLLDSSRQSMAQATMAKLELVNVISAKDRFDNIKNFLEYNFRTLSSGIFKKSSIDSAVAFAEAERIKQEKIAKFVRNNLNRQPDPDAIPRMSKMLLQDRSITDINVKDSTFGNITALHYQAGYGTREAVEWLLRQDPPSDINVLDIHQQTPLMYAVILGEEGKVRLLLAYGADRDIKDTLGYTALVLARRYNKPAAVIDLLENYRPDVSSYAIAARREVARRNSPEGKAAAAKAEAERLERERRAAAAAKAEAAKAETKRLERERLEAKRLERERAETERLERERAEAERLERERRAAAAAKAEAERLERERAAATNSQENITKFVQNTGDEDAIRLMNIMLNIDKTITDINVRDSTKWNKTALHYQAHRGTTKAVKWLLQQKPPPDIDVRDSDGNTPLMYAVRSNEDAEGKVKLLLEYGADIDLKDNTARQKTALDISRLFTNKEAVANLLEKAAATNSQENITKFVRNNLHSQPDKNASSRMDRMLNKDKTITDINVKDSTYDYMTALHYQAAFGTIETVTWLLQQNPPSDINVQDSNRRTALMFAVFSNIDSEAKVKLLLNHKANRDIKDDEGNTALDIAKILNKPAAVIDLLEKKQAQAPKAAANTQENISKFVRNNLNYKPDYGAISRMDRMLNIDKTITDINVKDRTFGNTTALHYQVLYGTKEAVEWLLKQNPPPDINIRSVSGVTPLMDLPYRKQEKQEDILRLLLDHGANRDLKDNAGRTALDSAILLDKPPSFIDILKNYRPDVSSDASSKVEKKDGIGVKIFAKLCTMPGGSYVFNEDNTVKWGSVIGVLGTVAVVAAFRGGGPDCPSSEISINNIPKCFRNMKEYKEMTIKLHPDKNRECVEEAKTKFQVLNNNKTTQLTSYGEINENTYQLCNSSAEPSKQNNALQIFRQKQIERDNEYLKHEDNSTYKEDNILIEKLFNETNSEGSSIINEINSIFENIIKISLEIVSIEVKIYDSNTNNISNKNSQIFNKKQTIDNLYIECTKKIADYRNIIKSVLSKNGIMVTDDDPVIINAIVEYKFLTYMIQIEEINRCIYIGNGLINKQIGIKIDLVELYFGIPQKTLMITNDSIANNNQLITIYNTQVSLSTVPVISNFQIKNQDITPSEFAINLKETMQSPIEFKNINFNLIKGGNKYTRKNKRNVVKTKKQRAKNIRRKTSKYNKNKLKII